MRLPALYLRMGSPLFRSSLDITNPRFCASVSTWKSYYGGDFSDPPNSEPRSLPRIAGNLRELRGGMIGVTFMRPPPRGVTTTTPPLGIELEIQKVARASFFKIA